jgi:predicted transcriptional regulator
MSVKGTPPGPNAGNISQLTEILRPPIDLIPDQCLAARRMRRRRHEVSDIARRLGATEQQVQQALATMRTRQIQVSRRSLNVTVEAHQFVGNEAFNGEPCWETVDRLLGELAIRRAMAGVPTSEPQENSDGREG